MSYRRYVALGDSQTEGLNDGDEVLGYRGWADRLAEHLAQVEPELLYANLAVRGKRAAQVRAEQLEAALALEPDLATVMAGMNDLVRPGFDPEATAGELEAMFAALTGAGARVLTFTFPDIGAIAPLVRRLRPRVVDFNARIRTAAARHGVLVVDAETFEVTVDSRLWSADRIHATPLGHTLMAAAAAHTLGLSADDDWSRPLPLLPPVPWWRVATTEAVWAGSFLGPWAMRRLRGRSSGDGRVAKQPTLLPVRPR
ncbi:SGNH/GDSL hydrolase family protein [Spirillospora sp. CA-253888]